MSKTTYSRKQARPFVNIGKSWHQAGRPHASSHHYICAGIAYHWGAAGACGTGTAASGLITHFRNFTKDRSHE